MATAPLRSGFAETNSSRRVLGNPLSYRVGPWPAILGWTRNLYSSIRSSRSSSVASLPLPRSTPQLDRPLAHRRPVALHHLVGDAAPQHRPALVHEAGEEGVCLVVGDSLLVVDAAVQCDVDAEGQQSHAASLSHAIARGCHGAGACWSRPSCA